MVNLTFFGRDTDTKIIRIEKFKFVKKRPTPIYYGNKNTGIF